MEDYGRVRRSPLGKFEKHKGNKADKTGGGLPEHNVDAGTAGKEGASKKGIGYPTEGSARHVNIAEDAAGNGNGDSRHEPHPANGDESAQPLTDAEARKAAIFVNGILRKNMEAMRRQEVRKI